MGIVAFLVDWGIEVRSLFRFHVMTDWTTGQKLNDMKFESTRHVIEEHGGFFLPYITFVGIALALGLVAGSLVSYIEVRGSCVSCPFETGWVCFTASGRRKRNTRAQNIPQWCPHSRSSSGEDVHRQSRRSDVFDFVWSHRRKGGSLCTRRWNCWRRPRRNGLQNTDNSFQGQGYIQDQSSSGGIFQKRCRSQRLHSHWYGSRCGNGIRCSDRRIAIHHRRRRFILQHLCAVEGISINECGRPDIAFLGSTSTPFRAYDLTEAFIVFRWNCRMLPTMLSTLLALAMNVILVSSVTMKQNTDRRITITYGRCPSSWQWALYVDCWVPCLSG